MTYPDRQPLTRAIVGAWCLILGAITNVAFLVEGYTGATLNRMNTFVSELGSQGQPAAAFFRLSDLATGLLLLAGLVAAYGLLPRNRWLRLGLASAIFFSVMTVVDAFAPLDCVPSVDKACRALEESGRVSMAHQIHSVTGVLESFFGFLSLILIALGLWQLQRREAIPADWRELSHFLVITGILYALLSLVIAVQYLLETSGIGIVQRLQVVLFAAAMFALGLVLRHYRAPRGEGPHAHV